MRVYRGDVATGDAVVRGFLPRLLSAVLILCSVAAAGCSTHSASPASSPTISWVDDPVDFAVSGMTIYGTFHHPVGQDRPMPAALLIAGSGPTDRNGNTRLLGNQVNTLQSLAEVLAKDAVASLRYDKLGAGQTGLGPYAANPDSIGIGPFQDEAVAALNFLAARPGVDRAHLMVLGHSEGGLFALQLATGAAGAVPTVQALGLVESSSLRFLDHVSEQIRAQAAAAVTAGRLTAAQADQLNATTDNAIQELRTTGKFPANLPPVLAGVFNPSTALFLSQIDPIDPAVVAAKLPAGMPVLVTCSDADIQISCQNVDHLVSGLTQAGTKTDYVHLTGVDHVLKQDTSKTGENYNKALPFSSQLADALAAFTKENLAAHSG